MKSVRIPRRFLEAMRSDAESAYPREGCGLLLAEPLSGRYSRVISCRNVQNEMHARDPAAFPRDAAAAYFIDPHELLSVHREIRRTGEVIALIYHSHVDAPAVFSREDRRSALWEGRPLYPGTAYLIFEVREGKAADRRVYGWNDKAREFGEVAVEEEPD